VRFSQQLHELAATEMARLSAEQDQKLGAKSEKPPKVRAYSPADAPRNGTGKALTDSIDSSE
jgi:hypothetical protein